MSQRLEEWDWEYHPIETNWNENHELVHDKSKDVVYTFYEVWDPACVNWGYFDTYALAKEHARYLSGGNHHHVMYWKHHTQC